MLVVKWFAPIGLSFAVSLYTSNQAYLYCNVTFLQFMKEGNVIITFLMSCAFGLQVLSRLRMATIAWIIIGACLSVTGELHFAWIGFWLQLCSQLAECLRIVIGEIVLSKDSLKLDPLSYTLFAAPACLIVLLVALAVTWDPRMPAAFHTWLPYLAPNALLAFTLNVMGAVMLKHVS